MIRSLAFVAIAASASAQNVFPQDSILTAQEGTIEARSINGACVPAQSLRVALRGQALSLSIQPHKTGRPDLPPLCSAPRAHWHVVSPPPGMMGQGL